MHRTITEDDIDHYIQELGIRLESGQDRLREMTRRTLEDRERRLRMLENEAKLRECGLGMFWKY